MLNFSVSGLQPARFNLHVEFTGGVPSTYSTAQQDRGLRVTVATTRPRKQNNEWKTRGTLLFTAHVCSPCNAISIHDDSCWEKHFRPKSWSCTSWGTTHTSPSCEVALSVNQDNYMLTTCTETNQQDASKKLRWALNEDYWRVWRVTVKCVSGDSNVSQKHALQTDTTKTRVTAPHQRPLQTTFTTFLPLTAKILFHINQVHWINVQVRPDSSISSSQSHRLWQRFSEFCDLSLEKWSKINEKDPKKHVEVLFKMSISTKIKKQ